MVCGRLMKSFSAEESARFSYSGQIHPKLTSFADEVCATLARLFVYVGVLALFGILGIHALDNALDQLRINVAADAPPTWSTTDRSYPAFALSPPDVSDKSEKPDTYAILRHPMGGRKDVLRWSGSAAKPMAELEIYRPGREYGPASTAQAELAARMTGSGTALEAAGVRHGLASLDDRSRQSQPARRALTGGLPGPF